MVASISIDTLIEKVPFSQADWDRTPSAVQAHLIAQDTRLHTLEAQLQQLQQQVDQLQGRVDQTSSTSSKPPSSDSPFKKRKARESSGKRGGKKGHPGSGPKLLEPTEVQVILPPSCTCGDSAVSTPVVYRTHQVLELPPIEVDVTHFILHQSTCLGCGQRLSAEVPAPHTSGYGPRLSALMAEMAGIQGTSRRLIQDFCHSVLGVPISLGAIQKVIDRTSQALLPHDEAIASLARHAPVGYIDETPWYCQNALNWLWTMTTDTVSLFLIHPNRSKVAFFELINDWSGLLVSDGYGVYQDWVNRRQTCLAHLIRTARGLSTKRDSDLAACGRWALGELQRLCHMAKAPPSGGQWRAWYARFCSFIDRYHERKDDAGRLARRLQREMASLWLFLCESGVEATNNRAERALRFAVTWRKRSGGTDSDKGNRWVERSLSLRHTCRQLGQSTYPILVEALTSFFHGRLPNLAWLY